MSNLPLITPPPAAEPHARFWPPGVPRHIDVPDESLWQAFEARALATPQAVALDFLGRRSTWAELHGAALRLAAALQRLGVRPGDRVLLFTQNSPVFIVAFHALLRVGAVVVPLNPMNKADELGHPIADAQAAVAIASADIAPELAHAADAAAGGSALRHLVVFDWADALPDDAPEVAARWPAAWRDWLLMPRALPEARAVAVHRWRDLLDAEPAPGVVTVRGADLALLSYTSGTTGAAKGCMHSHATLLHNVMAAGPWLDMRAGDAVLVVVPMFHITGLVMGLLAAIRHGCRIVLLPRWDRGQAALAIAAHRVTHWPNIPTMVIDLLAAPELASFDLASLRYIGGGGAPMPDAVAAQLKQRFGLDYVEGYGLTETAAPTHTNPRHAPRRHCLGIPYIGTRARVIDPDTLQDLPAGEVGEIVVCGPQVFQGYWNQPEATTQAFVELGDGRYFRTGDLGRVDADGYFYLADRLKRMINASGFKVWPAEVEAHLHQHPAVQEACVIAVRDPYRGESVKAVIVPRASHRSTVTEQDVIGWAREHMAAYKYPRCVEFVDALPRSASGKVLWRLVQAEQDARPAPARAGAPP
jgi:fatty-acyl-CoA synthase